MHDLEGVGDGTGRTAPDPAGSRPSAPETVPNAVVDALADAVIVVDWDQTVIHWNPAAETLYGIAGSDAVGRRVDQLLETSVVGLGPAAAEPPMSVAQRAAPWHGRVVDRPTIGAFAGRQIVVEQTITEIRDSIDSRSGRIVVVGRPRDVTDEERLQAELVRAQKMEAIGQLVSGVAHELNNPLAAIIAFSQLIVRDPRLPADVKHDAGLLVQESERTRRIVQNLLDFARQRPPERHPTLIRPLVQSILDLQAYTIAAARVEVELDLPNDLPPIPVDRAQMQQVLLNLTSNAIHAMRAETGARGLRGRLAIVGRLMPREHREAVVRLAITDDGPGVAPEFRDRLFVPFFTTKPPGEGTGLGLPVSFGIVAAHGGTLTFEPGPHGRGATFTVELPVATDSVVPEAASVDGGAVLATREADADDDPGRASVLVLDDEPSIRRFLAKALEFAGHEPILAGDGSEALRLVRSREVDAMLCDHRMAGMTGTEVYEAVVRLRPQLARRFVFMSGDVLNPELTTFATAHDIGLLAKPFDVDAVSRTVRAILERGAETQSRG